MEDHVEALLRHVGEDPDRPGLKETPRRFLEAMRFYCSGYDQNPEDVLKLFEDGAEGYNDLVFVGNIPVYSLCEHHLAPFFGIAHIGYLPDPRHPRILGLSKFSRLVDVYARRLQVQERLTHQIAEAIERYLQAKAVGVVLRCRHMCMEARGVQRVGCLTYTSSLLGHMRGIALRAEFMGLVDRAENAKD